MKLKTNSQRILSELFKRYFNDNGICRYEAKCFEFFTSKNS